MVQTLVLDSLWQCLCPSFKPSLLSAAFVSCRALRQRASRAPHNATQSIRGIRCQSFIVPRAQWLRRTIHSSQINSTRLPDEELNIKSVQEAYLDLRGLAVSGRVADVDRLVETLVSKWQQKPNLRLYACLILVNINAELGSAAQVSALLDEMEAEGLVPDSSLCHDALKVLAIHPDCLLRSRVLQYMQKQWLDVSSDGWHDVAAGLLRERLIEQALETITNMEQGKMKVRPWLYTMAVYVLCDVGELSEALRLATSQPFTEDSPYHTIQHIWRSHVQANILNPSIGQCSAVLTAAARQADPQLASDVFRVLGNRRMTFEPLHYELLIQAYTAANDIKTAFTILCVMQGARLEPDECSTRPLLQYMRQDLQRPTEAFEILAELARTGRTVPVAAMNAVIEACIYQGASLDENVDLPLPTKRQNLERACEHYNQLHSVCTPPQPNTLTFNLLFRGCHHTHDKDLAMFLAAEMAELGLEPDGLTYDRLILTCLNDANADDALKYLDEMKAGGFRPRMGTLDALMRRCCDLRDPRCWEVLDWAARDGFAVKRSRAYLEQNWRGDLKLSTKKPGVGIGDLRSSVHLGPEDGFEALAGLYDGSGAGSGKSPKKDSTASVDQELNYAKPLEEVNVKSKIP